MCQDSLWLIDACSYDGVRGKVFKALQAGIVLEHTPRPAHGYG
jgi:hypothetical protein